jgi:hypothetical protein
MLQPLPLFDSRLPYLEVFVGADPGVLPRLGRTPGCAPTYEAFPLDGNLR